MLRLLGLLRRVATSIMDQVSANSILLLRIPKRPISASQVKCALSRKFPALYHCFDRGPRFSRWQIDRLRLKWKR
jgi:hypothetical protein